MELEKRIVLAAGGTGGHVFPAQSLAQELITQGKTVFIFTDGRGSQFKDTSFITIRIPADQLQGSLGKKIKGGLKLMTGFGAALYHLQRIKPHVVVGFGGYASFPTLLAASLLRLPTVVHQADAYFGRTNRLLAPFVTRIATSFPHVENIPPLYQQKVSFTGLPVRPEIQSAPYVMPKEDKPFYLLVTGGSQGARIFGEIIPGAIRLLEPSLQKRLYISQQCRPEFLTVAQALYAQTNAHVELSPFLEKMGEQYKRAHLIVSRAGASSVIEAALVGRPAIFVPYPYAMDDHQFYNAQEAHKVEGGWVIREKEFTSNNLAALLSDFITSPWKLAQAAVNIRAIAIPDASLRLADLVNLTS